MKTLFFARQLRKNSTDAERLFWSRVRAGRLGDFKFKRQQPIGDCIVDFVCVQGRLIVELDGGQHASSTSDQYRDRRLNAEGYRVLRFWNNEVLGNIDGVIETVMQNLERPSPQPSPTTGEGADRTKK
jgi:very-short-patch-repair endonuclease